MLAAADIAFEDPSYTTNQQFEDMKSSGVCLRLRLQHRSLVAPAPCVGACVQTRETPGGRLLVVCWCAVAEAIDGTAEGV